MNLSDALQKAVGSCAQPYYKHKKRVERESRPPRDYGYIYRPARVTLEERLFRLFPQGYRLASDGGAFTPMVRQLYYVMRRLLQEDGCREALSDAYHRTVLEKYEVKLGQRLCYRKAVGDMTEPHSQCPTCGLPQGCNLGTQAVDHYVVPRHRFNKVLYVEKTGFLQQLLQADLHNRFDVAIAAGAGFSPQAARELFAKIEQSIPVTTYVLHDADIAGLEIARTLGKELVHECYAVKVEDLGLRPAEAITLNLPSETVEVTAEPSWELKQSVSGEELEWLLGEDVSAARQWKKSRKVRYVGTRVELNAFTPREFIAWVEGKFQQLAEKVVPDEATIQAETAQQYRETLRQHAMDALLARVNMDAFLSSFSQPAALTVEQIRQHITENPRQNWQEAIREAVEKAVGEVDLEPHLEALLTQNG